MNGTVYLTTGRIYDFDLRARTNERNGILPPVTIRRKYIGKSESGGVEYYKVQRPSDNAIQLIEVISVSSAREYCE